MAENSSRQRREEIKKEFGKKVEVKQERKLKARREKDRSVWFGLGMFGLVGWSVAIPTLIGIALGVWIDTRWPSRISWTLTLLFIGVVLGCLNAWRWIKREGRHD
jgi:ATP synthase protein I